MAEKFDPAPFDKYADNLAAAATADREVPGKLASGVEGSFPASDPPSCTQPPPSRHDATRSTFWQRLASISSNSAA
jgi:hypothetical protein